VGQTIAFRGLPRKRGQAHFRAFGKKCARPPFLTRTHMRYRNGWVPDSYISARNLSKVYTSGGADLVVFSELNLDVERGEMLALVGESGAGKSTLLHLLGGLDRPSSGTICYGSTEISRLADSQQADFRNREIGFVWQIHYLLPEFTALENVMMPLLIRGWPNRNRPISAIGRSVSYGRFTICCRNSRLSRTS